MSSQAVDHQSTVFRWNAAGWFGLQLGSSIWLLIGSIVLLSETMWVGMCWLSGFLVVNGLGLCLWASRHRLRMHLAMQLLLLVVFFLGLGSVAAADLNGRRSRLAIGSTHSRWSTYGALLVVPTMMIGFYLRNRQSRNQTKLGASVYRSKGDCSD